MLLEADPLQDSLINTLDIQLGTVYGTQNCCWIFFYYIATLESQNVVVGCFYFFYSFGFFEGAGDATQIQNKSHSDFYYSYL